jgi:hypothetical protein
LAAQGYPFAFTHDPFRAGLVAKITPVSFERYTSPLRGGMVQLTECASVNRDALMQTHEDAGSVLLLILLQRDDTRF